MTKHESGHDPRVQALLRKGVRMPHPASVEIAPEVNLDLISGDGVTIHGGSRIRGERTVISAGCTLGAETPMTIEDCQLGEGVALKGGYASKAVFLAGSSLGSGAHVREGSILEEEANGAHTVGLKQTILFPFVTLGSLINFCDCLMAGGTSRSDHSEVGSSYIHFNYTPDGNKTTASLFGDVPRGVMLDQPPVFLGGQGGAVGPVHTGFGTVVAAGSVLRADVDDDNMLVTVDAPAGKVRPVAKHSYRQLARIVERNLTYVAGLDALEAWYATVRRPFFEATDLGEHVLDGALRALASGRAERLKRLKTLFAHLDDTDAGRRQLRERGADVLACFGAVGPDAVGSAAHADAEASDAPGELLDALAAARASGASYLEAIQGLEEGVRTAGTAWLRALVDDRTSRAAACVPDLGLFARHD